MGRKNGTRGRRFKAMHEGGELLLVTRSSDGQMLFLVNIASKMNHRSALDSRIAALHSGSSLFTCDAGQGGSNIRRWLIKNDWLEAVVALPQNLFYNTGTATFVWVLSGRKPARRSGRVWHRLLWVWTRRWGSCRAFAPFGRLRTLTAALRREGFGLGQSRPIGPEFHMSQSSFSFAVSSVDVRSTNALLVRDVDGQYR